MPSIPININFTGQTSSFVPAAPYQRFNVLNVNNGNFIRYASLQPDCVILTYATTSIIFPLYGPNGLYAAAISASPSLTYPPVIGIQPTSSTVTHPNAAYFVVSASAETSINYQWYFQSGSNTTFYPLVSTGSYTGSLTPALTASVTSTSTMESASYMCVVSNASGKTSSSVANLYVL